SEEKDRYNVDIRATNILLQGLPKDIYTLINHYTDAKDIWDNVKMLLEGSELTKEDQEFVTAVKLNRGLRDSNSDQLYAYLKKHETHAKENKMMMERFSQPTVDPLAWLSNVSILQHYSTSSSASSSTQVPQPLADSSSLAEDLIKNLANTLALLTQSYRTFLPQTNNQLRTSSNAKNQATIQDGRVVVQNVQGRPNRGQGMNPQGGSAAGYGGAQNRVGNVNQDQAKPGQARTVKCYNCNDEQPIQDLALNVDNVFQADDCDAFDSDVDEAPTVQTMFMANLSYADPITYEAGPSYNLDILSEVPDHELYQDVACVHHEGHVMYDSVQLDLVVDSHADYTIDSNMIPYDHYVKDNEVPVVHSDVSSVPTDAFLMIYNDMCESHDQSVSNPSRNTVVKNSLTAELATYKEHVELYEQRAKFELTKREQKINEQLRLVISDHNFKEETLKRELCSIKLQLASTINHNKSMVEEVSFLKKDFKQRENRYLEDFLDMKSLKEKVEYKLIKQDQSLQTVHMLCRPRPHYNELNKVAIGYKNPLCLTRANQIQPTLYNGHEIIKDNHTPAIVHNAKDTLEIAEITRKKINAKMNDPECVTRKVKIAPHDYSKENFLATFTPEKQLTLEQIFWSNDLMKLKSDALKERTKVSRPIKAFTVYLPNTLATLVPKVLPIKSQVKIHIFTLIQLFSESDKTCKKRITPTGLTEGERGFEQTKECYLKEVIPFFKTLKDNFEGIQKALTKEIKEMKDVFEELEAKKELINHFSKLRVSHLNLQLKYQNLKDSIGNNPPTPDKDTPNFDSVFVIGKMQASLQGKDNVICQLKKKLSQLQVTRSDTDRTLQVQTTDSQITKLNDQVTHLQAQNDMFRAENYKIKQHYKEFYDSIKITRAKHIEQEAKLVRLLDRSIVSACHYTKHSQELLEYAIGTCPQGSQQRAKQLAYIPLIRKKQVAIANPSDKSDSTTHRHVVIVKSQQTNVPVPPSTGVNSFPNASG
nr:hypothetical protein [Tanacetum cinerariifolium]